MKKSKWIIPKLMLDLCTACGLCADYCPTSAIQIVEAKPVIALPHKCAYCGICEDICPSAAIQLPYEIVLLG